MALYPHYGLHKPVRRPITGQHLLVGYTRSQRIALGALKFAGKVMLAFVIGWLFVVLYLSYYP